MFFIKKFDHGRIFCKQLPTNIGNRAFFYAAELLSLGLFQGGTHVVGRGFFLLKLGNLFFAGSRRVSAFLENALPFETGQSD